MPRVRRCQYNNCHALVELPLHYCSRHMQYEEKYKEQRERYSRKRYNKYQRNRKTEKKAQYQFYRTRQWVHLRQSVLDKQHYLCQYCLAQGKLTPNSKTVDHIIPIEVNHQLKAASSNLAVTCRTCHQLKTQWEQGYYGTGSANQATNAPQIRSIATIARIIQNKKDTPRL